MKNASSGAIFFLISPDSVLTNPNDIARIRPITFESDLSRISDTALKGEDQERIKQNLYRYRIEQGDSATILSSEAAEIFVNAISIQTIINDRYNGRVNVFAVKESDLSEYSDEAIIEKKLYEYVTELTETSIIDDTTIISVVLKREW